MTIREAIVLAFIERLEPLSPAPVLRCRKLIASAKERRIAVWEGTEQAQPGTYGDTVPRLLVRVDIADSDDNPPAAFNALLGRLLVEMAADETFGGLAESCRYLTSIPVFQEDGGREFAGQVVFEINYSFPSGEPYLL